MALVAYIKSLSQPQPNQAAAIPAPAAQ